MEGVISDKDYRKRDDVLEQELAGIRKQKDELIRREWEMRNLEQRIETIKKRLENGGMEKAAVNHMLKDIREIRVHEWQMEIRFDPMKMMELSSDNTDEDYGISEFLDYPLGRRRKEEGIWIGGGSWRSLKGSRVQRPENWQGKWGVRCTW